MIDAKRLKDGLREHARGLVDTAAPAPGTRVPTCPGWTLRDLVEHVGQAHAKGAYLIRTGGTAEAGPPSRTVPDSPADWPAWLCDGAEEVVAAYDRNPDGTVERRLLGTRPTLLWLRRMAHETAVHHADAALAAGRPFDVEADLAADAISEFLDLLVGMSATGSKPELAALRGNGERLCVRPAEPSLPAWVITRTPDGPSWELGAGDADTTLSGPVRELLLVLVRRLAPDGAGGVEVAGDRPLLDHWLAHTAF